MSHPRHPGFLVAALLAAPLSAAAAPPPAPGESEGQAEPAPAPASNSAPIEVVVEGEQRAPGASSLKKSEVRAIPGAFGDPFRAIEIMPGVTPVFSGLPYFYVRGAPPGNVGYFLDGVRVPALFHLLAGPAVVPGSLIQNVELFPGGYPAEYGRFAGGIVAGQTRAPSPTFHAEGTLRLVDAGAMVEAPLPGGLGSALAGARYSYTAPILSLFVPDFKLDYWDYQGRVALDLSPHDRITIFAFGSHDYSAQRQNGEWFPLFATDFHRVDVRYDARIGDRTLVQHAITFGMDRSTVTATGLGQPVVKDTMISGRTRVEHRVSDALLVRAGADAILEAYEVEPGEYSTVDPHLFPSRQDLTVGLFADGVINAGHGVELTPGVRVDLWRSQGASALSADVRFAVRVPVTDRVRLIDAAGLAHQAPGFVLPVPGLAIGGLEGGLQRSFQTSAGVEADLPLELKASATFFYNAFFNLSDPISFADNPVSGVNNRSLSWINDRALGSAYGMELQLQRKLSHRVGGFITYTLSRSSRRVGSESFAAHFDRTHVLNAALSWDIGRGFRLGGRIAFYTGTPLVPFYPPETIASVGRDRLPPFFRLDLRAEKRWTIGQRGYISLVAEMANATLSKEPNGVSCEPGYRVACTTSVLGPISIPSLGVEGGV